MIFQGRYFKPLYDYSSGERVEHEVTHVILKWSGIYIKEIHTTKL